MNNNKKEVETPEEENENKTKTIELTGNGANTITDKNNTPAANNLTKKRNNSNLGNNLTKRKNNFNNQNKGLNAMNNTLMNNIPSNNMNKEDNKEKMPNNQENNKPNSINNILNNENTKEANKSEEDDENENTGEDEDDYTEKENAMEEDEEDEEDEEAAEDDDDNITESKVDDTFEMTNKLKENNTNKNKNKMEVLNKLAMNLLNHQIVLKLFHFQTKLYGAHKASDTYLEKFSNTMDKFLEIAQGIYGKITIKKYMLKGSSHTDENITKHLDGMINLLRYNINDVLENYTDLINIRDELVGDLEQLKYLLSFQ